MDYGYDLTIDPEIAEIVCPVKLIAIQNQIEQVLRQAGFYIYDMVSTERKGAYLDAQRRCFSQGRDASKITQ